jgi:hypothetical protein
MPQPPHKPIIYTQVTAVTMTLLQFTANFIRLRSILVSAFLCRFSVSHYETLTRFIWQKVIDHEFKMKIYPQNRHPAY